MTANCVWYTMENKAWAFVELQKNTRWLLNIVGGSGAGNVTNKGDLSTVNVLDEIRVEFNKACGDDADDETVATDSQPAVVADLDDEQVDPMDALEDLMDNAQSKGKPKAKRKARGKLPKQAEVHTFPMRMRPACAGRDMDKTQTICVYRKPVTIDRKLYLRSDCLLSLIHI